MRKSWRGVEPCEGKAIAVLSAAAFKLSLGAMPGTGAQSARVGEPDGRGRDRSPMGHSLSDTVIWQVFSCVRKSWRGVEPCEGKAIAVLNAAAFS